jgi:hypothetical protein
MSARRVLISPLYLHRRSRLLWLWYVLSAAAASAVLWWRLDAAAGGNLPSTFFTFPWVRAAVVIAAGLGATAVTAASIAGPVGRIEDWLALRRAGGRARPLRVRSGDAFETLIRLLNEMHAKTATASEPTAPRRRHAPPKTANGTAPKRRASKPRLTLPPSAPRSASSQPNT